MKLTKQPIKEALEEKYGNVNALVDEEADNVVMPAGMTFIELRNLINEQNSK